MKPLIGCNENLFPLFVASKGNRELNRPAMFIRLSLLGASANIVPKKKKVQFSVNALHVHSMDLLSQYESSEERRASLEFTFTWR